MKSKRDKEPSKQDKEGEGRTKGIPQIIRQRRDQIVIKGIINLEEQKERGLRRDAGQKATWAIRE